MSLSVLSPNRPGQGNAPCVESIQHKTPDALKRTIQNHWLQRVHSSARRSCRSSASDRISGYECLGKPLLDPPTGLSRVPDEGATPEGEGEGDDSRER